MTKICDERPVECGDPACPCHEWSAKSPSESPEMENQPAGFLEPEPESGLEPILTQTSPIPATPDFEQEWAQAPRWATRTTEHDSAEYWFLRGTVAEQLRQTREDNRIFRQMAERRGLL